MSRTDIGQVTKESLLKSTEELKGKGAYECLPPILTTALAFAAGMAFLGSAIGPKTAVIFACVSALFGAGLRYSRERTRTTEKLFDMMGQAVENKSIIRVEEMEELEKELSKAIQQIEKLKNISIIEVNKHKLDEARSNIRTLLGQTENDEAGPLTVGGEGN